MITDQSAEAIIEITKKGKKASVKIIDYISLDMLGEEVLFVK